MFDVVDQLANKFIAHKMKIKQKKRIGRSDDGREKKKVENDYDHDDDNNGNNRKIYIIIEGYIEERFSY